MINALKNDAEEAFQSGYNAGLDHAVGIVAEVQALADSMKAPEAMASGRMNFREVRDRILADKHWPCGYTSVAMPKCTVRYDVYGNDAPEWKRGALFASADFCCEEIKRNFLQATKTRNLIGFGSCNGSRLESATARSVNIYDLSYGSKRDIPIRFCPFCGACIETVQETHAASSVVDQS